MKHLIEQYDRLYPEAKHLDLARMIIKDEDCPYTVRTLREYISNYRNGAPDEEVVNQDPDTSTTQPDMKDMKEMLRQLLREEQGLAPQEDRKGDTTAPSPDQGVQSNNFTEPGNYLVLGCVHAPFHNTAFINALLNLLADNSDLFSGVVFNGDFMDMNSLSAHDYGKLPHAGVTLGWEYEMSNRLLDRFDRIFDGKYKAFINGNHEDRYWRAIQKPDSYKLTGELRCPTQALRLKERGFDIVLEDWKDDYVTLGNDLQVIHGAYTNEHVAKKHVDVFRTNVMFAHCHRIQTYHAGLSGYAIGAGANFDHEVFGYAPRAMKQPWENGCAVVNVDEDGEHHVQILQWKNNKLYFNGNAYTD